MAENLLYAIVQVPLAVICFAEAKKAGVNMMKYLFSGFALLNIVLAALNIFYIVKHWA